MAKKNTPSFIYDTITDFSNIVHLIHTGEGMTHGPSHLSQWIPYFEMSQENFAVLVRHYDLYKWVRENFPYVKVALCKNPNDIENLLNYLLSVRAIYYISNTGNLLHTLRYNNYQHIFLGHGDSDKSASAHKYFRVYDQIWVAGQAHIDRFKNAEFGTKHLKFVIIGRPQLNEIIKISKIPWEKRFKPNRILYLPTWEGVYEESNYSSVRFSPIMLHKINEEFKLPISAKFHPVTGSRDKLLENISSDIKTLFKEKGGKITIASKSTPVSKLLPKYNILICDISAVVSECIATDSPLFIYIPKDKKIEVAHSNLDYSDYAYTFSSIEELTKKLEKVLSGDDYLKEKRKIAMDYLINIEATSHNQFTKELQKISSLPKINFYEILKVIQ